MPPAIEAGARRTERSRSARFPRSEPTASGAFTRLLFASILLAAASSHAQPIDAPYTLDLGSVQPIGALFIDWDDGHFASRYAIEVSRDGTSFETVRRVEGANGGRDSIYLGHIEARQVRLAFEEDPGKAGYAVRKLEAAPAAGPNDFFLAVADAATRGAYPRYLLHEQPYWTAIGADGGERQALVASDGPIEVDERSFSIEPFVTVDGRFVPWSNAFPEQTLADDALPIPSVAWHADPVVLTETAFVSPDPATAVLYARYRLENRAPTPVVVTLWLGLRPFQVNPPWQSLNGAGGVSPIHHLARDGRAVRVNGAKTVVLLSEPEGFGAARFEQGSLTEFIAHGNLPPEDPVSDATGFASGALRYRFELAPGASGEASIAVPFDDARSFLETLPGSGDAPAFVAAALDTTQRHWQQRLAPIDIRLPPEEHELVAALRSAVVQILVARAGPALRPGTRTYARSWIRDGVLMGGALLQMGLADEARAFLRWYAPFQDADGRVPCCIDRRGGDWAVEHDSPGELIFGVLSLYRYARDLDIVRDLWPNILRAVDYIDLLRKRRLGPEYQTQELRRFRGILPESISHEGYSAHPVHSYWDDYWALRGLSDAVIAAELLGDTEQEHRIAALRDEFAGDLRRSIVATMEHFGLATIPASADLGDFDPSATSIALAPGRLRELLPQDALERTYDRYVEDFRKRRAGEIAWEAYTPYELRNVEALVRLDRRDDALYLLREMLADQRPPGWHAWGEIVWRDPTAPRFIGDMPHGWIASGYVRALRSLLVYEREDGALVLGAGLPLAWLRAESGVAVAGLPTHRGSLSYQMRAAGEHTLAIDIAAGLEIPSAGILVRPPVAIRAARIDGAAAKEWRSDTVVVRALPAHVEIEY